jgi:hypothetical protein
VVRRDDEIHMLRHISFAFDLCIEHARIKRFLRKVDSGVANSTNKRRNKYVFVFLLFFGARLVGKPL